MSLLTAVASISLFCVVVFFLGLPIALRFRLDPLETLITNAALSLLGVYTVFGTLYVSGLPNRLLWVLPILSCLNVVFCRRGIRTLCRDPQTRNAIVAQGISIMWCVGWLALIKSYSGGLWTGDWLEHWQRANFFLKRLPVHQVFISSYLVPARPPLVNMVTAAFMSLSGVTFAHFQLFTTLVSALVFLPATLIARQFGGKTCVGVLLILVLLNPLFVQNATFAWTKLPTVFFVLLGLYFTLKAQKARSDARAVYLAAACLAGAILCHYSAVPYALVLGTLWMADRRAEMNARRLWGQVAVAGTIALILLGTWFAWSLLTYGWGVTFLSNSTSLGTDLSPWNFVLKNLLNMRDTLVPHFLRSVDWGQFAQVSRLGYWRDWFFQLYQLNFLFSFGAVGWLVLLRELWRARVPTFTFSVFFWTAFIAGIFVLGVVVNPKRDDWGVTHICLQPLVFIGLAFLAARWETLEARWKRVLRMGLAIDFLFGVVLQFGLQNYAFARYFGVFSKPEDVYTSYNEVALINFRIKAQVHLRFFGDDYPTDSLYLFLLLLAVLAWAIYRSRLESRSASSLY